MTETDTATAAENEADKILEELAGKTEDTTQDDLPQPSSEDDVEKPIRHKEWVFQADYMIKLPNSDEEIPNHFEHHYTQKPLSYHAMIEFTGLLARVLDRAMSGPNGLTIEGMFGDTQLPLSFVDGKLSMSETGPGSLDVYLKSVFRLLSDMPDLVLESQCIWLRVPRSERPVVIDIWAKSPEDGGMRMRDGQEMMELFIEQNYEELAYFLTKWWSGIASAVRRAQKRAALK